MSLWGDLSISGKSVVCAAIRSLLSQAGDSSRGGFSFVLDLSA